MKNIVLIDGNALMHRSYHGVGKGFIPMYEGMPIGMVFGFASTLLHILDYIHPDVVFVTFDTKEKTFRHEMDSDYKAHRTKAPDDFYPQVPYIYELLDSFDIPVFKKPGYESDDIIGTIALKGKSKNNDIKILSGDLDFLQLVDDHVKLMKFNGKIEKSEIYGPEETYERYGVRPDQIIDFKALTGDSSDNYKGIVGLGPKTATKFLQEYESIKGIYTHLDELPEKWRERFEENKDYVVHCQKLAEIHTDVPVEFSFDQAFRFAPDSSLSFFQKMKFGSLEMRYQKLYKNFAQEESGLEKAKEKSKESEKPKVEQGSLFDL